MKLLLVNGEAAENGPGRKSLDAIAKSFEEEGCQTELFWPVRTKNMLCSGCGACRGAGMCVADPRGGEFLRAAAGCDGFVLAAPVGLLGLGIDFRNLLRRASELTARSSKNPFAGKPAAPLIIGRLSRRAAKELRELAGALGLNLCELTYFPALIKGEEQP